MSSEVAQDYFEFIANLGMTKHPGSMETTRKLIALCHIGSGKYVLDVGCGVGATPCYLAKAADCRVLGIDLLEEMIEQSRERALAEGVQDRVEFRAADARKLPFEDNLFDAVISESVNVFFDEKQKAMSEYVRVTKPGGYVGLTELTWLKPPSPEMVEYYERVAYVKTEETRGWTELMEEAGLKEVVGTASQLDIPAESKGRFERYGWWGAHIKLGGAPYVAPLRCRFHSFVPENGSERRRKTYETVQLLARFQLVMRPIRFVSIT